MEQQELTTLKEPETNFNYAQNINNSDTGSIMGQDANGGLPLDGTAVIPDGAQAPSSAYNSIITNQGHQ